MTDSGRLAPGPFQLIADYEELRPLMKYGLSVLPDTLDLYIWHGVVFCHSGRYKGGVFRFIVCAHPLYPADGARPLVVFLDKPYHFLVDPATGLFQLEARFDNWQHGIDRLPPVIEYLYSMLVHDSVRERPSIPYNSEASHMRAANSARDSVISSITDGPATSGVVTFMDHGEEMDKYVWARSPLSPDMKMSGPIISKEITEAAKTAAKIGKVRGFRFSEAGPAHLRLLDELSSGKYTGSEVTDLLVRGFQCDDEEAVASSTAASPATSLHIGPHMTMMTPTKSSFSNQNTSFG